MRGRLNTLGLLAVGLSLSWPATRARADYQILQADTPQNSATTNQNLVIAATQTNFGPGTVNLINDPFQIQQFDPTKYVGLGADGKMHQATLAEVVVSLKYEFDNTIQMSFVNSSTSTVTAQGVMRLDVNNPLGQVAIQNVVNTPTFYTSKTLNFPKDTTDPNFIQPTPKVVASTSAMGYSDTNTLNTFTGKGTLSLPVYATATSSYTNSSGNGAGGSLTTASAALSVTYYYYFVPEPSSLALTGLGAFGLCVFSRVCSRRKVLRAA